MAADPSPTPGDVDSDRRQRRGHSAAKWGLAALGWIGAAVLAFVGYMFVPSLLDAVVYTLFGLALVVSVCIFMTLIRFGEYPLTPGQPAPLSLDPSPSAAMDTFNRETVTDHGPELAKTLRHRALLVPFHWWEWLAMFVLVVGGGIAAVVFLDKGQQAGWLPRAHDISAGIVSSVGAAIIVGIVMVWGILRSPALEDRRGAMILVTLIALLVTLPLGIIGSLAGWRPFVSSYSGRGAGVVLGVVFVTVWMLGYWVTKPTPTR